MSDRPTWQNVRERQVRPIVSHLTAEVRGEMVFLNQTTGKYFGLNSTGVRVLELANSGLSLDESVDVLSKEYSVERTVLEHDVCSLLGELLDAGLVELAAR